MKTIPIILMLLPLILASKCNEKYSAPEAEDCVLLTVWDAEKGTDKGTCFCIDDRINKDTFDSILTNRVEKAFNTHPLKSEALRYLAENKEKIIKTKEYEVPFLAYCRGFPTTNPSDKAKLENWAEENRLARIKAESNQKKK